MKVQSVKPSEPVNMNRFDNYFAIVLGMLNVLLFNMNQETITLLSAIMSMVVLIVRNFRRIVMVLYDFYLLASAKNRDEIKQLIASWREARLNPKKNDDDESE